MIPMRQANLCSSHVLLNSVRYTLHTGLYSSGQESGHTHVVERSSFTTHIRPLVQKTFRQGSVERMRENEILLREINDGHIACEQRSSGGWGEKGAGRLKRREEKRQKRGGSEL